MFNELFLHREHILQSSIVVSTVASADNATYEQKQQNIQTVGCLRYRKHTLSSGLFPVMCTFNLIQMLLIVSYSLSMNACGILNGRYFTAGIHNDENEYWQLMRLLNSTWFLPIEILWKDCNFWFPFCLIFQFVWQTHIPEFHIIANYRIYFYEQHLKSSLQTLLDYPYDMILSHF